MLKVSKLCKGFSSQALLKGVSFDQSEGELVGLIGPSGQGKSVLLKIIGGIIEADSGTVKFEDQHGKAKDLNESTGFLFQSGALFDSRTVLENTMFPLSQYREFDYEEAAKKAYNILSEVGLSAHISKLPGQLSGGMRRRVALARALVSDPELVLLDDPTAGLDPVAANVTMELIERLHRKLNSTTIVVSHDLRRLVPRVDRLLCLFDGQIGFDGASESLVKEGSTEIKDFISTRYDFSEASI